MIGNSRKTLVRITRKAALMASFCALASTPLGCPEDLCSLVRALPGGPDDPSGGEPTHLAVGDSITASNKDVCQSLACHAGIALGVHVQNNAIDITCFLNRYPAAQYVVSNYFRVSIQRVAKAAAAVGEDL